MTLEKGLAAFLDAMLGKNRSSATLRAYRTDVLQFIAFLKENNVAITEVGDVSKVDVLEYLAALAKKGLTGVARARKVSAIREYFRFLEGVGIASCKFVGDDVHLRGGLLWEPQLLPLLVEFNHF